MNTRRPPIVTQNGFSPGSKGAGVAVGRDLCAFSWISQTAGNDRGKRLREAELEALRIAMTKTPGVFVHLWPDGAAVWAWDDDLVTAALRTAEQDELVETPRFPESLVQAPEIASDGLRLAMCENGVDGQHWRQGRLVNSRWWRAAPGDRDWLMFAESAGVGDSERPPAPLRPQALSRPWRRNDYRRTNAAAIDRRVVFWGAAGVVAAMLGASAYIGGVEWSYLQARARVAKLERAVAPVKAARAHVMETSGALRTLEDGIEGRDGLALLSRLAAPLSTVGVKATMVEFREDVVRVAVPRERAGAIEQVLRALEEDPELSRARLDPSSDAGGDLVIEADLGQRP